MNEHTSKKFDSELEGIRTRVLQMGGMVELQIVKAMEGLSNGDLLLIDQVIENDNRVNLLEIELDEACNQVIAKRQPTAVDLRMVSTVQKTITDLERIGDEAKKIAKTAKLHHNTPSPFTPPIRLNHIADAVVDMLRTALDSYARLDTVSAAQVVRQDKEVDAEFKGIMRQLITYMMEDPRTISQAIELMFVAKSVERIGDHAKNIAEYVVYMVKGRDVRHTSLEEIEREAMR
ncbi:MAG: phosphate signaling complex protein PhoU [Zoogloea sp.]|uniref:phosphate signaling complex protein PhoU n=1 Tax=Dokdonella sp. TaxID=2291710 RepID=UPI001B728190|nr:phosphate signaling complex protein PhoU [Dokdonella sp.]MBL0284983.1 phosphate signaling complex protein PhoU [Zoogloea sp.]MBP7393753.1 phosphate signaling complex protein PhoU [Zoogloea sp.]